MMMRLMFVVAGLAVGACGRGSEEDMGGEVADTVSGETAAAASGSRQPATGGGGANGSARGFAEFGNILGRVPILEYHIIADTSSGMFVVSQDQFRRDLELLYDRGYRPITVAQLIDKDFRDVPAGMSPVVFTFDDASPGQFSYVERNGKLEIDPRSAVGIWQDFRRTHPDWGNRATFCLLSNAEQGHALFGNKPEFGGQKPEWRPMKLRWLVENGFELCNHTLWHARLDKYDDAFVQEQIARAQLAIDSMVPGHRVRTLALPLGKYPRNRELAWRGSWTDPRAKRTITYSHETVLEVAGGPERSPYDPAFDRRSLKRVIVFGETLEKLLDRLDATRTRLVVAGGTGVSIR